ncbi:MAG: hypothetical protein RL549_847 [Verrucomicrobiota bacterium]
MLAGLGAGVGTGLALRIWHPAAGPFLQAWIEPWGQLFLRLLFLLVIPVLFTALPLGIASAGSLLKLGRTALIALVLALGLGAASVLVALVLVNVTHPGKMMAAKVPPAEELALQGDAGPLARAVDLIPGNPFGLLAGWMGWSSAATMMLAILGLAVAWGFVLLLLPEEKGGGLKAIWERAFEVCMQLVGSLIRWAPGAVFCLTCLSFFRTGPELLGYLGTFVFTVLLALGLQGFGVYPLILRIFGKYDLGKFWRGVREPLSTAFATASSNATLPVTLRAAEGPGDGDFSRAGGGGGTGLFPAAGGGGLGPDCEHGDGGGAGRNLADDCGGAGLLGGGSGEDGCGHRADPRRGPVSRYVPDKCERDGGSGHCGGDGPVG